MTLHRPVHCHLSQPVHSIVWPLAEMHKEGNYTNQQPLLLASPNSFLCSPKQGHFQSHAPDKIVPICVPRRAAVQGEARVCETWKELLVQEGGGIWRAPSCRGKCTGLLVGRIHEQRNIWAVAKSPHPHSHISTSSFQKENVSLARCY